MQCFVCLECEPVTVGLGCACRGDSAAAHVACMVSAATHGSDAARWSTCATCNVDFTGPMQVALAVAHMRHAIATRPDSLDGLIAATRDVGVAMLKRGSYANAESLARTTHALFAELVGAECADALQERGNVAACMQAQGRFDEADAIYAELVPTMVRVLGESHKLTVAVRSNVCNGLEMRGAGDEPRARAVVDELARLYGAEHPKTLGARCTLASALINAARYHEAEAMQDSIVASMVRVLGANHPDTVCARMNLAWILFKQHRAREATALQSTLCVAARHLFGPDDPVALAGQFALIRMTWRTDRAGAAALLRETHPACARVLGAAHATTQRCAALAALLAADQSAF
jgi:hypothetical protein